MKTIDPHTEKLMAERFGKDSVIALATDENGLPHARFVDAYYENGAFYSITHALSGKMRQIEANPCVAIAGEWFTGHGKGESLGWFCKEENKDIAGKLREAFAQWINNEHNDFSDENTILLRVELTDGVLMAQGQTYNL